MSKELKYINEIQNELDRNPRDKWKAYWNGKCNVIRNALTPPTEKEVCKALSEYLNKKVFIDKRYKNINLAIQGQGMIAKQDDKGNVRLSQWLPPHLITMIGRIYENKQDTK